MEGIKANFILIDCRSYIPLHSTTRRTYNVCIVPTYASYVYRNYGVENSLVVLIASTGNIQWILVVCRKWNGSDYIRWEGVCVNKRHKIHSIEGFIPQSHSMEHPIRMDRFRSQAKRMRFIVPCIRCNWNEWRCAFHSIPNQWHAIDSYLLQTKIHDNTMRCELSTWMSLRMRCTNSIND